MREIKGTTKMCALLGNPTEHSLSPLIHNNLAYLNRNDMAYTTFCVEKDNLEDAIKGAFALGIVGMNVTVPYKEEAMKYLVGVDPIAKAIGAVNTLVRTSKGYYGYNTDILGFTRELEENNFSIEGKDVVILGAGGVARAIAFACAKAKASKIYILNRSLDKAAAIAKDVDKYCSFEANSHVIPTSLDQSERLISKDFLLVQTTNVGMYPKNNDILIKDSKLYKDAAFAFDVIYNPYETAFMKAVKANGIKAVNGLPMLLYQGVEAYRMWFPELRISKEMERGVLNRLKLALRANNKISSKSKDSAKKKNINQKNIILVGFMGSGKTTLGKWIARNTGRKLIDTDKEIEKNTGKSISEIFKNEGEESFRQLETSYLNNIVNSSEKNLIISVGGGTPLRKENRDLLKKMGTVVYLKASADELMKRLQFDKRRPLLAGKSGEERKELIESLLSQREDAYCSSANMVISTDGVYFPRIYQIIDKKINHKKNVAKAKRTSTYKNKASYSKKEHFSKKPKFSSYKKKPLIRTRRKEFPNENISD